VSPAAALARLRNLGVTVEARGDWLALRPASAVPADLLAALRAHKAEVLALLAASDAEVAQPPSRPAQAGDKWGLTATDRAEALTRLRAPGLSIPTDASALLRYLREDLYCRVWVDGDLLRIGPTHRCRPAVVEAALAVVDELRLIVEGEA
jgi:TubC N-terminal docking domain